MSRPEGQDKTPKLNECKGTIQIDGKPERRLLVMIAAGIMCQTISYSPYRGGVAISELLATGTRGRDTNKAWDLNNMPVDRVVIAPKAFSPETLAPGNNPTRKFPWKQATGKRRKQSTAPGNRPRCGEATQRQERTEQGLLFRTAAGAVCQIGGHDGCGMCVLTLAILATGAQAKEVSGPQDGGYHMGERTGATQET